MANRLLPFRLTSPHDELSHFALANAYINENITGAGLGDAGVFVSVASGNLNLDPVTFTSNSYLGKTDYPYVGFNAYPEITLKVRPAASGDIKPLGITLVQTAKYDENGQKLLYYREKAESMQVALPGESTKILTKGIVTVTSSAVDGSLSVNGGIKLSANSGKVTGCALSDSACFGMVLGTGSRGANGANVADAYSGAFYQVKFGA